MKEITAYQCDYMKTVREYHDKAMEFAQQAAIARFENKRELAEDLAIKAMNFEIAAAELVPENENSEPTRSILYRSAASLGHQGKQYKKALRMIYKGLSGFPPENIKEELIFLQEQILMENHLELRGIQLTNCEFQYSFAGDEVGDGMILYQEFKRRMESLSTLIRRTSERLLGRAYQSGGPQAEKFKPYETAISTARSGSYALTIRLIETKMEVSTLLTQEATPERVIYEIISGMDLINNKKETELESIINNRFYYKNFLATARDLLPDGKKVKLVGFTSSNQKVGVTRTKENILDTLNNLQEVEKKTESRLFVSIEGTLNFADSRKNDIAGLTSKENKYYRINIAEGFDDVIRSYNDGISISN